MSEISLAEWLALASVCALGAMSPGPSLFVVLRAAVHGGAMTGVITGLTHALGVGIYAIGAIVVLSGAAVLGGPVLLTIQIAGIAWLIWLSIGLWNARASGMDVSVAASARDGFLIVFLNPKMLAFFLALFSPFVDPDASMGRNAVLVLTPAIIDGAWYAFAAMVLAAPAIRQRLIERGLLLNRAMALVLSGLAVSLALQLVNA